MVYLHCRVAVLLFLWRDFLCEVRSPPDIGYPSRDEIIYFRDSEKARINCSLRGDLSRTKFKWTRNGTVLQQTSDLSYDEDTGHLVIGWFSRSLEGTYRCIATRVFDNGARGQSEASSVSPAIHIKRCWIQPIPVLQEKTHTTKEFHPFSLACGDARISTGPIKYQWYIAGTKKPADDGDRIYNSLIGILFFEWIDISDRGKRLVCSISAVLRGVPYTQWGRINTLDVNRSSIVPTGRPFQRQELSRVVARRLTDAHLECVIGQHYFSNITYKFTYWDLASGVRIQNTSKYNLQFYGRILTIRNVTEADEMFYICSRYNDFGKWTVRAFLDVTSAPLFTRGPPPDKTVIQGEDAEFNCEAHSVSGETTPHPPVWSINGNRLGSTYNSTKFQLNLNDNFLIVKNTQKAEDIMCVQCEVANNVDTAFANACLNVLLPIVLVTKPPEIQTVEHGDIVNLTVKAIGDPAVKLQYRWEFQNNSFEMNKTPPYYVINADTMEVYINTSLLTVDMLGQLAGRHTIFIFHEFETRAVGTDVIVVLPATERPNPDERTSSNPDEETSPGDIATTSKPGHPDKPTFYLITMPMIVATSVLAGGFFIVLITTVCVLREAHVHDVHTEAEQYDPQKDGKYGQNAGVTNVAEMKLSGASIGRLSVSTSVDHGTVISERPFA